LALAVFVLILLSPLLLVTSPLWLGWYLWQRRGRRARNLRVLLPFMADTAVGYARVMISDDAPGGNWSKLARNLDDYIADTRSPRIWRLQLLLLIMQLAPMLRLRLPFTLLSEAARRDFIQRNLRHASGLMRIVSLGRQLLRLAYYAAPATHQRMGFVPFARRRLPQLAEAA
jgi:hypothetical protein